MPLFWDVRDSLMRGNLIPSPVGTKARTRKGEADSRLESLNCLIPPSLTVCPAPTLCLFGF